MSKILYTAVDRQGRTKNGYIHAQSNEAALESLTAAGFSEIRFHDDGSLTFPRGDLEQMSPSDLEAAATFELEARQKPGFGQFILGVLRANAWATLLGLGLLAWGLLDDSVLLFCIGAIFMLGIPLLATWNYRVVSRFDRLLLAFAEGRWADTRNLIASLRHHSYGDEMAFDLDIREACANAEITPLDANLSRLDGWAEKLERVSPGLYESRVASVYHHYGRYDRYLELMREAYAKSPDSPVIILDLALAEARLGDPARAGQLLESLDAETVPTTAPPFLHWVQASIQRQRGGKDAGPMFRRAISGMIDIGGGAATLPSLAVCVGDYAVYCADTESPGQVGKMLATVWPVLRVHGETPTIDKLVRAFPDACKK